MTEIHGIKPEYLDRSANPGVDFNQFANGTWIANTSIPPEYPRWGAFLMLAEKSLNRQRELLEAAVAQTDAPIGSSTQLIGDFYFAGMDEAKIEAAGATPLAPLFELVRNISSKRKLADVMAKLHLCGVSALFGFGSSPDIHDAKSVIAHAGQGGLGLPDRDYYLKRDKRSVALRAQYVAHVQRTFELLGERKQDAHRHAKAILVLETALARVSMTKVQKRDPENMSHKMTVEKFAKIFAGFDVQRYFKQLGTPAFDTMNVMQPKFFKGLAKVLAETAQWKLKAYLRWQIIRGAAAYLSSDFVKERFAFYGQAMQGTKELSPRWKRVISMLNEAVGEALGELYVGKYFPPESKARMLDLIANVKDALREAITAAEWMSKRTRKNALVKLESIEAMIGYPDVWKGYQGLVITRDSLYDNALRATKRAILLDLAKIGTAADRSEWHMTPQTVNAYYSPQTNQIVFPAGILEPPFFDAQADDAANYGGIGVVIGHEMTHGFDDKGAKYNAIGNLENWWSKADLKAFSRRVKIIIEQFNGFAIAGGKTVNGQLVAGEAASDLGGVVLAYRALRRKLFKTYGAQTDDNGFTDGQRFFIAFAQLWATKCTPEYEAMQGATDPHPPGRYRVNGTLAHVPEFAEAFGLTEENCPLLLPADKRCKLW